LGPQFSTFSPGGVPGVSEGTVADVLGEGTEEGVDVGVGGVDVRFLIFEAADLIFTSSSFAFFRASSLIRCRISSRTPRGSSSDGSRGDITAALIPEIRGIERMSKVEIFMMKYM